MNYLGFAIINNGVYAIVTFAIAFIAWAAVLMYPLFLSVKSKWIYIRTALLISFVIAFSAMKFYEYDESVLFKILRIVMIGLFVTEIIFLFTTKLCSGLPLISGVLAFIFTSPILRFAKTSYQMWNKQVDAGSVRFS